MFPKAKKAKVDGEASGARMAQRKAGLIIETQSDEDEPQAKRHLAEDSINGGKASNSPKL